MSQSLILKLLLTCQVVRIIESARVLDITSLSLKELTLSRMTMTIKSLTMVQLNSRVNSTTI